MRILQVSLAIVALAAPVASARAQEAGAATPAPEAAATVAAPGDQGWSDTWALLFQLNNIFQQDSFLSMFDQVGIGAQYYLAPDMAVRLALVYARGSTPLQVTENVDETAGTSTVTYGVNNPTWTSNSDFRMSADFLYRLSAKNVAPYTGGGLWVDTSRDSLDFTDDASTVNQVVTRKGYDRTTRYGLRGVVGAEWRLHPSFAVFAEYGFAVTLASQRSTLSDTVTEVTIDGERTVHHTSSQMSTKHSFDIVPSLQHSGQLGLAVNF